MNLLTRYLARQVYGSITLVFAALLMLFSFLDLIHELNVMGVGNYNLGYVLLYVLLTVPGHVYELFPVAVLIGSILALVQMASSSELTIYRCSGASPRWMVSAMLKIGLPLVVSSFLVGEVIAPPSEHMAQELRMKATNSNVYLKEFRSGVWAKDGRSFVNVRTVQPDTTLLGVRLYEMDPSYHLETIVSADRGAYVGDENWQLDGVTRTHFEKDGTKVEKLETMQWRSSLTPDLLNVLLVVPEQMSAWNLYQYTAHLDENHQRSARYAIAFWNKLIYPLVMLVMLALALPFAAHRQRDGGIGGKVFAGIVLGLAFHFLGKLVGSLGAINEWPPFLVATCMPVVFLSLAAGMLWWTERR